LENISVFDAIWQKPVSDKAEFLKLALINASNPSWF